MDRGRPPMVRGMRGRGIGMTGATFSFPQPAPDLAQAAEELPPFTLPLRRPMEPQGPQAVPAAPAPALAPPPPAPAPAPAPPPQALAPHLAQPTRGTDLQPVVRTTVAEV